MSHSVLRDHRPEENGVLDAEEEGEEEEEDDPLPPDDEVLLRDRRRARSLPAYPGQADLLLLNELSQTCRKRVKFADALGLNLASIKHFSSTEDPEIPSKVFSRLQSFPPQPQERDRELLGDLCVSFRSGLTTDLLVPTFQMPSDCQGFENRLRRLRVALEKVVVTRFDVRGLVRVGRHHGDKKKEVGVRYTFNEWLSFVDAQAVLVPSEDLVEGERFSFTMYTPPFLDPNSSVHFAVYLRGDEAEFWDNNDGQNYTLRYHCLPPYETATFCKI